MKAHIQQLVTPFETSSTDWNSHPRPQMKRESFLSLCGEWGLCIKRKSQTMFSGLIQVPFPPESRISGIMQEPKKGNLYIYKKTFLLPDDFLKDRLLLHFGAVDQIAKVYVNDRFVGEHAGGYLPFTFDITSFVAHGENTLSVEVIDDLDTDLPYGKQRFKRGGMWYTPISGIWQPVWLECVPESYIQSLRLTPTLDSITIETVGGCSNKTVIIRTENGEIKYTYSGDSITISIDSPHHWTPEDPFLYPFTLCDGKDTVESYFALRTISAKTVNGKPCLCLNGKPYFFHGLLDQGYFSDGIYLPSSPEGYLWDIKTAKKLGFNMLRKHIKLEPELFYYYCDTHGMIVFQDMVNSGKYHYISDTVLPTIGLHRRLSYPASSRRKERFETDAKQTVQHLYNHPSVCCYTIFNEGWGQYHSDRIYRQMKAWDSTRICDSTSGWFAKKDSDVVSEHIYFRKIRFSGKQKRPLVLSEFGGYSFKVDEHSFNLDKNYGYKTYTDASSFERGLDMLYRMEIIPQIQNGLCATVLTQLSDVEDETNGLVTYDRQVVKVSETVMNEIAKELFDAFYKQAKE